MSEVPLHSTTNARNQSVVYTSLCTGELNAIRKHKRFLCSPFYVKGVSLGHVGRNQTLKDLKDNQCGPLGAGS